MTDTTLRRPNIQRQLATPEFMQRIVKTKTRPNLLEVLKLIADKSAEELGNLINVSIKRIGIDRRGLRRPHARDALCVGWIGHKSSSRGVWRRRRLSAELYAQEGWNRFDDYSTHLKVGSFCLASIVYGISKSIRREQLSVWFSACAASQIQSSALTFRATSSQVAAEKSWSHSVGKTGISAGAVGP
jgi:hypothetical protein